MPKRKSILFVSPDYHCSFFYRDELRKLGWKADIYVGSSYPEILLYSDKDILKVSNPFQQLTKFGKFTKFLLMSVFYLTVVLKYKYHFYYGGIDQFNFMEQKLRLNKILGEDFRFHLWLAKLFNRKIIHLPSGCLEEETKANFSKLDGGNICNNCGWGPEVCNDYRNIAKFNLVRKYADMAVGTGSFDSSQYRTTHFKYKALDLDLWHPSLAVPDEFRLPCTNNLRILHSFCGENRNHGNKNIKGSPFIVAAINQLKEEGFSVEHMFLNDVPSKHMRFYQVQADIVIEQLIYGWWGSTGVETMALGLPVVCYLRPAWKKCFLKTYPEYESLPIVEANTETIYDVLKKLIVDKNYRKQKGRESRSFAEQHFDVRKNAVELEKILLEL